MKVKKSAITISAEDYESSPAMIEEFGHHIERRKADKFLTVIHEVRVEDRDLPALEILGWPEDLDRLAVWVKEKATEGSPRATSSSWLFDVRPINGDWSMFILISWDHAEKGSTVWASCVGSAVGRFKKEIPERGITLSVRGGGDTAARGIVREFSWTVHSGPPQMRRWCAKAAELFIAGIL
mgnify:CR=1 FL=1